LPFLSCKKHILLINKQVSYTLEAFLKIFSILIFTSHSFRISPHTLCTTELDNVCRHLKIQKLQRCFFLHLRNLMNMCLNKTTIKETLSRDFRPLVFFSLNNSIWALDPRVKAFLHMTAYSRRYSTMKSIFLWSAVGRFHSQISLRIRSHMQKGFNPCIKGPDGVV
jgi:hypothetical protein